MELLPVDALRDHFIQTEGVRVLTAPPGSGKSTRVPLWCAESGKVWVVQPRRVAARSLAVHLAREDGSELGVRIGFAVRGEQADRGARVLFMTPGVALRKLGTGGLPSVVVLDEFHERTLDVDLLAALLHRRQDVRLVLLSATVDGDRVAQHFSGTHLRAPGRLHPVEVRYESTARALPHADGLGERVRRALESLDGVPGDRLVFIPGRRESQAVVQALRGLPDEVVELHGRMTLDIQDRVFRAGTRRRVVVATNVAETSVTLPRIGAVVDTGLVRRTHYHQDRGYLMLAPIAMDSADQRTGRAGRLGPGIAIRLWGERAPLAERTPPAVHRESLVPLVLAACVRGFPSLELPFVDVPPAHAVETARQQLIDMGAVDSSGATERGRRLFGLPLDAHLAHLLVVAERRGMLGRAIDLCAALSSTRALFTGTGEEDLRDQGCDATALIRAVDVGEPVRHGLSRVALSEVRSEVKRLNRAFGDPAREPWDRLTFAAILVEAWPRCGHVPRRRKRFTRWSNGGTEVGLSRSSCIPESTEALLALDFRASGRDRLDRELQITAALPLTKKGLADLGLGRDRLGPLDVTRGQVTATVETVYAGTLLRSVERPVDGDLAREAVAQLLMANRKWKGFAAAQAERMRVVSLYRALEGEQPLSEPGVDLRQRLESQGLETLADLQLLEWDDLLPADVEEFERQSLERDFPSSLKLGTSVFRVEVHAAARLVILHNRGKRLTKRPPASWLPSFRGFDVTVEDRGVRTWLRRRR